jgi:hypothetical protein
MSPIDRENQTTDANVRGAGGTTLGKLSDLTVDVRNANTGTERGRAMLEESLRRDGPGRSILADRHLRIIGGNHVVEVCADLGLDECIVVPTDGRKLVVVQRTDIDLDSPQGRAMSIADNRVGQVNLNFEPIRLAELAADEAVDLTFMFSPVELADLLGEDAPVPRFEPEQPAHRLDELAPHCPTCSCRKAAQL